MSTLEGEESNLIGKISFEFFIVCFWISPMDLKGEKVLVDFDFKNNKKYLKSNVNYEKFRP